jgi:hypothetical protein
VEKIPVTKDNCFAMTGVKKVPWGLWIEAPSLLFWKSLYLFILLR